MQRPGLGGTAAALVVAAIACAQPADRSKRAYVLSESYGPAKPAQRFLVAPPNHREAVPFELGPGLRELSRELGAFLSERGHRSTALSLPLFKEIWSTGVMRVGGLFASGKSYRTRYDAAMRETLVQLGQLHPSGFDALIVPTLIFRPVRIVNRAADWDGVSRSVLVYNEPRGFTQQNLSGTTEGISLQVEIYARDGARVFRGYGGLALAYRLDLAKSEWQLRGDALSHPAELKEGLELAFDPFIPRRGSED